MKLIKKYQNQNQTIISTFFFKIKSLFTTYDEVTLNVILYKVKWHFLGLAGCKFRMLIRSQIPLIMDFIIQMYMWVYNNSPCRF